MGVHRSKNTTPHNIPFFWLSRTGQNKNDKINKEEHRSQKAAHDILQPETPKGMSQDTHTQTNRGRTH